MFFLSLFLILGNNGRVVIFFFSKIDWGEGWDSLENHMCHKLRNFATKSIIKHFPKFSFYFIIIWWNFNHTWLTRYVDACNLWNCKYIYIYKEKNWCNSIIWSQNAKKPLVEHLFTTFLNFIIIGWEFTHTWLTTYVDACNLQNWKGIKRKKNLMQLCDLATKCHIMLGDPR
jgi:hypothetical protein